LPDTDNASIDTIVIPGSDKQSGGEQVRLTYKCEKNGNQLSEIRL
jgi:hypothetical protein